MEQMVLMTHDLASQEVKRDQVITACQAGDQEAFRILFELHQHKVYSIALHYSGNEATAHDISQQVFIKLLTQIRQYNFQAEFTTWLYRLVANACFDERRRWRRWVPFGEAEAVRLPTSENIEADYSRVELGTAVRTAIAELKPKLRLPILLKYLEGMTYDEIAQVLGCSPGTVASRLNRAHQALAQKLSHLRGSAGE